MRLGHYFRRTEWKFSKMPVWQKRVSCCRSEVSILSCTMVHSALCWSDSATSQERCSSALTVGRGHSIYLVDPAEQIMVYMYVVN